MAQAQISVARDLVLLAEIAPVVAVEGPEGAGVRQQFRAQFEPLLKVELSFASRVCELTDEQRRALIRKSNGWLDEFVGEYAKQGGQPQHGLWVGGMMAAQQPTDVRESIAKGIEQLIDAELPKEQAARYREECRRRSEFEQKVAVDNLVAQIDKELKLGPEQRAKLAESLAEHWNERWAPQLESFVHGVGIWPNVPDAALRPHLTPAQLAVWKQRNKQTGHMFVGGFGGMENAVIDDIDLEEGAEKAADADPRPADAKPVRARNLNVYQAP